MQAWPVIGRGWGGGGAQRAGGARDWVGLGEGEGLRVQARLVIGRGWGGGGDGGGAW